MLGHRLTRSAFLFICVLCYALVPMLELACPSHALAEDEGAKESQAKRKRKRQVKKGEGGKEDEDAFAVVGGKKKFGHAEFDEQLKAGDTLDAVLVIDSSRSMKRTDPNRLRDQGAKLFLRFLSPGDRVAIIQFDQDTKILSSFKEATPEGITAFDQIVEQIPAEGNFTDLWTPIVAALQLQNEEGRPDAKKAVVVLSDGKMDPSPAVGSASELSERLMKSDLPLYRQHGVVLYTLGMSTESDRDYLAELAKATGGLYWYAPDVNTIHRSFSDLFLALKNPQVLALSGAGFEVDGSTSEATFYLNRTDTNQEITLTDPQGRSFGNTDIPPGVKWYRGGLFDVITIANPLPGRWAVSGLENPEGFATLLTDLKLQVRWPQVNLQKGDTVALVARLTEKGESVSTPGMKDITFYSYKIIDSQGNLVRNGNMNDKGEEGDVQAGDGIYSARTKMDVEGEFKALVAVAGPTFTRQQHISFEVSSGLINLELIPADKFANEEESFRITVSPKGLELKKIKVQLMAKMEGEEHIRAISVDGFQKGPGSYLIPASKLKKGEYDLHARLSGFGEKSEPVKAASETIKYSAHGKAKAMTGEVEVEVEEHPEHEDEAPTEEAPEESEEEQVAGDSSSLIFALAGIGLSLVWVGVTSFIMYRKAGSQGTITVESRAGYNLPEEIEAQVTSLRQRASDTRREPTNEEKRLFALVWGGVAGEPTEEEHEDEGHAAEEAEAPSEPEEDMSEAQQ